MNHEHHHHSDNHSGHKPEPAIAKEDHGHHKHSSTKVITTHHKHDEMQNTAYDQHAGHHTEGFLKRFWICLFLTIPVLLLSHMVQQWFRFEIRFAGDSYVLLALGTLIYAYGGYPFLMGMIREIQYRNIGMMTLVALAISVAYVYSVAVIFGLQGMDFFWELATLVDIMLLGHWLEMRAQMSASRALESLVALLPSVVHIEHNGNVVDVDVAELKSGDIILIKPGEKLPADGLVIEGTSYVNESMLTGESVPVQKEKEAKVIAGSINGSGSLKVQVTGAGKDSYLNKVINLVQSAQSAKSTTQNLANKVARWLTIISITIGIVTFIYWYNAQGSLSFALERMVTVMVTSCPHALGVAIPLVVALSTALSATHGLLIRNRTAFEGARNLTTIIFDKTGTLTKGSHEVQNIIALSNKYSVDEILQYTAAAQQVSEHHIAHGILNRLKKQNLDLWRSENFQYMPGMGISAMVNGKNVIAAGPNYFTQNNLPLPTIPGNIDQSIETISFVLIDNEPAGIITLADSVRENAAEAVRQLKVLKIKSFLLTGDNEKIAAAVATKLGMDGYLANVLPHEKQSKVQEFQNKGEVVAMTGDGVNDAPALAQADVGIAVGSGTDVAAETADIILVNSDPVDVVQMISFAKATYNKMRQNLGWAVGYNVIAIPLAAGVLYPHFMLSPAMGAVLMSLSTIVVAFNAQLLKRQLK